MTMETDQSAGHPDPAADTTEPGNADAGDPTNDHDVDTEDDQDDGRRPHREKQLRQRAQVAEGERDQLADTLTRTRQAIVDGTLASAGLDPRLFAAAGHDVDSLLGEDGLIDAGKLAEAVANTTREFNVRPGLSPNPQQGAGPGIPASKSVGTVIKGALGR